METHQPNTACSMTLEAVSKRYDRFTLGPVSTSFRQGVTALLGSNGAGKSTLIRRIAGVEDGEGSISFSSAADSPGYLPQDFTAPLKLRAREYLEFVAWCRSSKAHPISAQDISECLERVDLKAQEKTKISALSGGMLRRLGIAQALLGSHRMVVLDEPTVGLDPIQRRELRELLRQLGKDHTIVVSTHLSEDVAAIADHVIVLNHGTITFDGSLQEMLGSTNQETAVSGQAVEEAFIRLVAGETHA